jgi:uncharacterized membrane protein
MAELRSELPLHSIVWTNHHHLMRYATEARPRLLWLNFAHLFSVLLLPLATAWMAVSELAPQPVAFDAAVFFLVNATYVFLIGSLSGPTRSTTSRGRCVGSCVCDRSRPSVFSDWLLS